MSKNKITSLIILTIIIVVLLVILGIYVVCKFSIGFKFGVQSDFSNFLNNIKDVSNIEMSFHLQSSSPSTEEKEITSIEEKEKLLNMISETEVKATFERWLNKSCIITLKNNKNNSEITIIVMPNQISVVNNNHKYNIKESENNLLYNYLYELYNSI